MKSSDRSLIVGAAIAFFLTFTLAAFAGEPPAPPAPPAEPAPPAAPAEPAAPEKPKPAAKPKPSAASDFAAGFIEGFSDGAGAAKEPAKLRRLDEPAAPAAGDPAKAAPEKSTLRRIDEPSAAADDAAPDPGSSGVVKVRRAVRKGHSADDYVRVADDITIAAGETVDGDVIGILSDVKIDGAAAHDTTAVLGDVTINGQVHGDVSAVWGDVTLGPGAVVDGDVTAVGGQVHRDPRAKVLGKVSTPDLGKKIHAPLSLQAWWMHALSHGALLGVGHGLGWLAKLTAVALGFYALVALVFPGGIRRTGDVLVQRPVAVVVSGLLTTLALPILFLLLCITVIGVPFAILGLPVAVALAVGFGQAAIYGLVGRAVTRERWPLPAAVLVGALIFVLGYHAPVIGLVVALLVAALGFGCSVTALLTAGKKPAAPIPPVAPLAAKPASAFTAPAATFAPAEPSVIAAPPVQSAGFGAAEAVPPAADPVPPVAAAAVPGAASAVPPPLPAAPNATLLRAGFWIRVAAIMIDLILVGMIFGPLGAGELILPGLAAYGAAMWKFKGTTIGGIVCGLRVVRLDDRPLDWPTTVVRALGCFLSLAVAGLGFVWVAFDRERQSWHDKIAGTVVVRAPKGVSLV